MCEGCESKKCKSAECARVRTREKRISQLFTSHAVALQEDVQKSRNKEGKNDGEKT